MTERDNLVPLQLPNQSLVVILHDMFEEFCLMTRQEEISGHGQPPVALDYYSLTIQLTAHRLGIVLTAAEAMGTSPACTKPSDNCAVYPGHLPLLR